MRMARRLAALLLVSLLFVGGCSLPWGKSAQPQQGTPGTSEGSVAEQQPDQANGKEKLNLPMYGVGDAKIPTVKLGEPLQVGPVTVTVTLDGATYEPNTLTKFALYRFHVAVVNEGKGTLDLNPRSAYWIADGETLKELGSFDQRVNWWVVGRRSDEDPRLLIYPDPDVLRDLGYPKELLAKGLWATERLSPRAEPLPGEVPPGASAEGDILWWQFSAKDVLAGLEMDPDEHYYLFFGNWLEPKAWGRIDLGPLPKLYEALVKQVGPNPPEAWNALELREP